MPLKASKVVSLFVLLLMLLQTVGPVLWTAPGQTRRELAFHEKKPPTSAFETLVFEKVEEESVKSQGENGADRPLLIDFSNIAQSLSLQFTPKIRLVSFQSQHDIRPPVYTLNCVLLI